jgi:hypothetical protein
MPESARPTRLLRLKNANVATTKVIKLPKVGWVAAYGLKGEHDVQQHIDFAARSLSEVFGENDRASSHCNRRGLS